MKKYFYTLILCFSFVGCVSMQEYRKKSCNYESAYAMGVNDAQDGRPMNSYISEGCDQQDKEAVSRGYREGYSSVVKQKKQKQIIYTR